MNTDTYYIPVNFPKAGRILGLFEIRNLVPSRFMRKIVCGPVKIYAQNCLQAPAE